MSRKILKAVLTYSPEAWRITNPEKEAMLLMKMGFYPATDLKKGIIYASPNEGVDPCEVFSSQVTNRLSQMGVSVTFEKFIV